MALVRIAWRSLWRGWRRATIVLVSISIGLWGTLLLIGWTRGMAYQMADNAIRLQLGHVVVQARGYQQDPDVQLSLPPSTVEPVLERLRAWPGASGAPRVVGEGLVQSARTGVRATIVGVDPTREAAVSLVPQRIVEGDYLAPDAQASRRRLPPVVIGRAAAERLGVEPGHRVVLRVPGEAGVGAFRVRGLFQTASSEFDRTYAFIALGDARHLYAIGDGTTQVAIALERPGDAAALQAELRAAAAALEPVEVLDWQEREPRLAALLGQMQEMGWIFYGVVFVAMVFGIANALLMGVYERIREFAVLRAIGLRARRLVGLVLLESLLLTAVGTGLGLAIGFGSVLWLGHVGLDMSLFAAGLREYGIGAVIRPRLDWSDLVSPASFAAATAILAGLWPAWRISRLRPAEALRRT